MNQYHRIIEYIQHYGMERQTLDLQTKACVTEAEIRHLSSIQWPTDYDPIAHTDKLRWGLCFGKYNKEVDQVLQAER